MKENKCLYFMKGAGCLLAVLVHIPIPGIVGDATVYTMRFIIPIFFMITGYFSFFRDLNWIKASQRKVLKLILVSEGICGVVNFITFEESVREQIQKMRIWRYPLQVLISGTLFNGTLWYLYAMLWTWLIICIGEQGQQRFLAPWRNP